MTKNGLLDPVIMGFVFLPLMGTSVALFSYWLFAPHANGWSQTVGRRPVFGWLAVTLPPLALPLIYCAALILESIGGSPLTQSSDWSYPEVVLLLVRFLVLLTLGSMIAGLPLGLVGWVRRERLRWLSLTGMILSLCVFGYFLIGMHFLAGGN